MTRGRFRLRRAAMVLAALVASQAVISITLLLPPVHRWLLSGLQRAIGRPVEVSRFGLTLWNGPRLVAYYITVDDDPAFSSEFLLRADRMDAVPDWRALLRGRLDISRVWLQRPSLNVVRTPSGIWNYQALSPAGGPAGGAVITNKAPARPLSITLNDGRINFKRGPEKLSLALLNVKGDLAAGPDGRWSVALSAQPFRAGVTLQDAGTIRLQGSYAVESALSGTAAPAELSVQWEKASVPDALRLLFGRDFGVRGRMESAVFLRRPPLVQKSAASGEAQPPPSIVSSSNGALAGSPWSFSGSLRLADVHRWDLSPGPGLPAANLSIEGVASADRRRWEISSLLIEAPRSNVRARAVVDLDVLQRASVRIVTANIRLEDLLGWYRAFHPGVSAAVTFEGDLGVDVELEGWPPSVVRGALVTTGARLRLPEEQGSLYLGRAIIEADHAGARLKDSVLTFSAADPGVRLSANWSWGPGIPFAARAVGKTDHLATLSSAVASLGLSRAAKPVEVAGAATVRLGWSGSVRPWQVSTSGSMTIENLACSGGFLRSQIHVASVQLDFGPGERRLRVVGAKAFGGNWSGILRAPSLFGPWDFRLAADHADPALLIRGFSNLPPENSSLLSRLLPAQAAATVAREEPQWPAWIQGDGTLSVGTFSVGRLEFSRLNGRFSIGERSVTLESADATLAAGKVRGSARGVFAAQPEYSVRAEFNGVNLAALSALTLPSRQCCAGTATGRLDLEASGWKREELLASLKGTGSGMVRNASLLTLDLPASFGAEKAVPGRTSLRDASGDFSFANGHVWLDHLILGVPAGQIEGKGNADYSGQLDLRLGLSGSKQKREAAQSPRLEVKGTLVSPQIFPATTSSP